jgi:hypothetical protein
VAAPASARVPARPNHRGGDDLLAIYTDGITEAFDAQDDEFGEGRLVETLHAHRDLPPRDLIAAVYDGVRRFSPHEQRDDMTLIARGAGTASPAVANDPVAEISRCVFSARRRFAKAGVLQAGGQTQRCHP